MKDGIIRTTLAPQAIGPYSQAVQRNGWLFMSGQLGLDPATGAMVEGGVEAQTRQILANLGAVLEAAGGSFKNVVKTSVFLKNLGDFAAFNAIYAEVFSQDPPARATVEVSRLPKDALIEIEAVAFIA